MAAGYECPWGDPPHAGEIIVTWLDSGATLTPCREHFSPLMIHVLATDLGVDPDKFYAHVEKFVKREAAAAARQAEKGTAAGGDGLGPDGRGESTQPGDPGSPEVFANDGVIVRVPDTRGGEQ